MSGRNRLSYDSDSDDDEEKDLLSNSINSKLARSDRDSSDYEPADGKPHVYKRRWYMLLVVSLMIALEAVIWNTWSPISSSAQAVFGWSDGIIALLSNWAAIAAICVMVGFSWLLDSYGLRVTCILTAFLTAAGSALRCITSQPPACTWLINIGHVMNGMASVMAGAGCSQFSAVWFPNYQRATSTAIALSSFNVGTALSFVAGPLLVHEINGTKKGHVPMYNAGLTANSSDLFKETKAEIMRLMYYECGLATLILLMILIYFPAKPPTPPSVSASSGRVDFKQGLKKLVRMRNFWIIAVSYGISMGVGNSYTGVMDVNLKSFNIHQNEAGWIGFYAVVVGTASAVITARVSDMFAGHMKAIIALCLFLAGLACTWSVLLLGGYIPFNIVQMYVSSILVSVFENGAAPLMFELACETSYPVAEAVSVAMMAFLGNLVGIIFLLLLMIPGIGAIWMNWCMLGSCFFCFGLMLFFNGTYARLQLDSEIIVNSEDNSVME